MLYINGRFLTQSVTGVQRFAYEITNELLKIKNNNIIILVPRGKIYPNYNISGWNIKYIGFGKGYFWEQVILPFYLTTNKSPLLISLCNLSPIFYKNKITVVHDLAVIEHPEWFNWKFVLFYNLTLKSILYYSKFIITVSNFSKSRIKKIYGIQSAKIGVVYNAVSKKLYMNENIKCTNLFFNFLTTQKFILCVASIDLRKNFKRILEAFNLLKISDLHLVIVGKRSQVFEKNDFETEINDHIHFIGYVSDEELFWLYYNTLFFIYLSLYEGFGIPPLEAMANGCPVLLSDIPVHKELYGDAAFFVNPYSVENIKLGMNELFSNELLRNELARKGYDTCRKFSWNKSAQVFSEFILKSN